MAFGPITGAVNPLRGFHYTFTCVSFSKSPLPSFALATVHPQFPMVRLNPFGKDPLPAFNPNSVVVNWTNPLSGHMFPVKPLPGTTGGGGGGGGTVGYGS